MIVNANFKDDIMSKFNLTELIKVLRMEEEERDYLIEHPEEKEGFLTEEISMPKPYTERIKVNENIKKDERPKQLYNSLKDLLLRLQQVQREIKSINFIIKGMEVSPVENLEEYENKIIELINESNRIINALEDIEKI